MQKLDLIVFIGRFQPAHTAHIEIINRARTMAKKVLLIVGSSDQPREIKNPFTYNERRTLITLALSDTNPITNMYQLKAEVVFAPNIDTPYNDQAWTIRVQEIVRKHVLGIDNPKIGIIGHKKPGDVSTFYLDMFPQWQFINQDLMEPLDATMIRDIYFTRNSNINYIQGVLTPSVFRWLKAFRETPEYDNIMHEKEFIENYKKQFSSLSYAPTFVTSDAVVVQSGHVLMIKRKDYPGKGLWALPGGFLNAKSDRNMTDCMLRELREETGIKVPEPVLRGNIKNKEVFDAINRSARGRTITHAFHIELPAGPLPRVKGSDDAEKAKWIPINELTSDVCFEDHYHIIQHFVGIE